MSRLSKSKLLYFLQCPKRLWLQVHRPELAEITPATRARFDSGRRVGEVARTLYDRGRAVHLEYSYDIASAVRQTQGVLFSLPLPFGEGGGEDSAAIDDINVLFEATFEHQGVLVRTDILEHSAAHTRLIEVKGAAELREEHVPDVAIQTWVLEGEGVRVNEVTLAHINNQFLYCGDGNYAGLLTERPISDLARRVAPRVPVWSREAQLILARPEPAVRVGTHCRTPNDCPFIKYCWPKTRYPLTALPRLGSKLDEYVARGYRDVRDVPEDEVSGETRLRVWRATVANRTEIQPSLREELRAIPHPRYYLDFETISFAVPIWPGTRPYQAIPFQWSIHVETSPGAVEHLEYLDLSGELPARELSQRLLVVLGRHGPILTYSDYERQCIRTLAQLVPMLADPLHALEPRLIDLLPILQRNYYHPDMQGSWSIKAVLPTVVAGLRYEDLGEVREGDAAQRVFLEAINPATPTARKEKIARALLRYCAFDTEAMARLVEALSSRGVFTQPGVST